MAVRPRRWLTLALAPLVAVTMLVTPAAPASAEPGSGNSSDAPDEERSEAREEVVLNDVLESSNRRFFQAKTAVAKSIKNQKSLAGQVRAAEARRDVLIPEVSAIAAKQYKTGDIGAMSYLLGAGGTDEFLSKAVSLEEINALHNRKLAELNKAINQVNSKKAALDAEVKTQQANLAAMKKQKKAADDAYALLGGNTVTKGLVDAESKKAALGPGHNNGFPKLPCNQDDPTTGGCITARTLHMLKETQKAGFDRFVGCFRPGGPFEHPKGMACDWSLQNKGFANFHNDDMFKYGNDLMAFLVRNADRLGVYYVIWNKQIYFPARGSWSNYHGPSAHTDHVHVSML